MVAVMLSRAIWFNIHLHVLHEMNIPLTHELIDTGLPTFFEDDSSEYVSMLLMGQFLSKVEKSRSIGNLALLASERVTRRNLTFEYLKRAALLPTLSDRLLLFFHDLPMEWNCARSWITKSGRSAKVHSAFASAVPTKALRYFEWIQHAAVRSIIREYTGSNWNPEIIAFRSSFAIDESTSSHFPNTRILVGQPEAYLEFPSEILNLKLTNHHRNQTMNAIDISTPRIPFDNDHNFIGALKLALRAYLPDYYPSLDVAAAIAGLGARTLQRRLAQLDLTYSALIGQVRLESAIRLLGDPNRKIIDIAYKVGYHDPSHFTRAFRRSLGASPKHFRQCMIAETKAGEPYGGFSEVKAY